MNTTLAVHGVKDVQVTPVYRSLVQGGAAFQYITVTCADGSTLLITAHLEREEQQQEAA